MSGQEHLPAPGGADRPDGADGQLRPGGSGAHRAGGPHLHPHRRAGRDPRRAVHLHGRDDRDGQHPATTPPGAACSSWTRSGAAPAPTTASPSPGRWSSTSTTTRSLRARTLFATHYHELTQLARSLPGVRNYNVAVSEADGKVVFLHKIVPGGADRSYGIHVAQLAGLPKPVIQRANEILHQLEASSGKAVKINPPASTANGAVPGDQPAGRRVERTWT